MKLLALDVGERRIGLAVGGGAGGFEFPAGHVLRTKLAQDIAGVLRAVREREAEGIVVGMPYNLVGEIGPQAKRVQGFIRALKKQTSLPVYEVDERFTSFEAEALLRDAGSQPSRNKPSVDEAAAVLIIRRFLQGQTPPD